MRRARITIAPPTAIDAGCSPPKAGLSIVDPADGGGHVASVSRVPRGRRQPIVDAHQDDAVFVQEFRLETDVGLVAARPFATVDEEDHRGVLDAARRVRSWRPGCGVPWWSCPRRSVCCGSWRPGYFSWDCRSGKRASRRTGRRNRTGQLPRQSRQRVEKRRTPGVCTLGVACQLLCRKSRFRWSGSPNRTLLELLQKSLERLARSVIQ